MDLVHLLKKVLVGSYQSVAKSDYDRKRNTAIFYFLAVCQVVAINISITCSYFGIYNMAIFSFINFLLWTSIQHFQASGKENWAKYVYVFTTNISVFECSYICGFDLGFYFYILTSPFAIYLFFNPEKKAIIRLVLVTYLINFILMLVVGNGGRSHYFDNLPLFWHQIIFSLNIITAFYLCYILANFFLELDSIRIKEANLLITKKSKLENEYKQLDLFNYIVSHNLKGPLGRIKGLAQILGYETAKTPNSTNVLHHIKESVEKMDEMISDLNMILSHRKKAEEAHSICNLKEIIEEVKQGLESEINESHASIKLELETTSIKGIKSVWHSILHNLISNSIKYRKTDAYPAIIIKLAKKETDIVIQISDNGMGIDLDKFGEKIFLLYNRFHTDVPGKGIGLFLVRNHVSLLGGDITLFSNVGIGTTFTITIPSTSIDHC